MNPVGDVRVSIQESERTLSIEIETERLKIVSVTTDQYNAQLIDLYGSKQVNALVGSGATLEPPKVIEKIRRWQTRWAQKSPYAGFVVVEKESKEFIGQIILKPVKDHSKGLGHFVPCMAEIGYLSLPSKWGKKYCHEYTSAILVHLVPKLISAKYRVAGHPLKAVMATARVDNPASNAVLRKFMDYTGRKPRYNGPREWYERKYVSS